MDNQSLHGVQMYLHDPVISHLFFDDDTFIFLKATRPNCSNLVTLIHDFCETSGQAINFQKSCVFFGANTPEAVSTDLGHILNMPVVSDLGKYLGLPALWGRSKRQGLAYVKCRILQKHQGWKQISSYQSSCSSNSSIPYEFIKVSSDSV